MFVDETSRKERQDDESKGVTVEGRVEDDGMGVGDVVKERQGVEYRVWTDGRILIKCRKCTHSQRCRLVPIHTVYDIYVMYIIVWVLGGCLSFFIGKGATTGVSLWKVEGGRCK